MSQLTSNFPTGQSVVAEDWAGAVRLTFRPGEEIYAQDEDANLIYRVVRGSVRTTHLQSDGRRQVGDFYYEGDIIGVEIGEANRFSAEALTACEVLTLRRYASADHETSRVERVVSAATARELQRTQSHLLLLGRATAYEKVARFLMDIANRFREEFVILPMNRQDMADYLGLTIETISRMLSRLQAAGVIEFSGSRRFRVRSPGCLSDMAAT